MKVGVKSLVCSFNQAGYIQYKPPPNTGFSRPLGGSRYSARSLRSDHGTSQGDCVYAARLNVLQHGESVAFSTQDPIHRAEYRRRRVRPGGAERLDVFSTPATLVDHQLVAGFNRRKLGGLLGIDAIVPLT